MVTWGQRWAWPWTHVGVSSGISRNLYRTNKLFLIKKKKEAMLWRAQVRLCADPVNWKVQEVVNYFFISSIFSPKGTHVRSCQRTSAVPPPRAPTSEGVGASAPGLGCGVPASQPVSLRPWRPVCSCARRGSQSALCGIPVGPLVVLGKEALLIWGPVPPFGVCSLCVLPGTWPPNSWS